MIRIINGERRYGASDGCPRGDDENPTCCIEKVDDWIPRQCSRKRGHGPDGLYCGQHAKKHNMEAQ